MADSAHPLVLRAREALARSELKTAEQAVEERLKVAGRDINALEVRYLIQKHRGQLGEAARTLDTVIGINSRADWAHNALLHLLMSHGKVNDAEQVARTALRANPNNGEAHHIFGSIVSNTGDLLAGETHLRRALEVGEPRAPVLTHLAENLRRQGRLDEADKYFARAYDLAPTDVKNLTSWSSLCEARGDLARAGELLNRAEAASSSEEVSLPRSRLLALSGRNEQALETINAAKELSGEGQLARGRLHERLGQYEEAWQDFTAAKRKIASDTGGLQYKADAVEALFGRLKQFFTRENMAKMPFAKVRPDVPQPIFILGFPRSGAAVVERILANQPGVSCAGDLGFLGELRKVASNTLPTQQPFPDNLALSWMADLRYVSTLMRDYYLARAEQRGVLAKADGPFTDRAPLGELYLPLLKMAFPNAKIIYVVRHPLDVCVSVISNNVTEGFNCGYRVEDTAHHLAAMFDLFQHYRRELEPGEYVVQYESLIADPIGQTRKLLDYLGRPSDAARAPEELRNSSINRHQHYAQQLKSYRTRLQAVLAAFGYS